MIGVMDYKPTRNDGEMAISGLLASEKQINLLQVVEHSLHYKLASEKQQRYA
jgi:hypothetical protein